MRYLRWFALLWSATLAAGCGGGSSLPGPTPPHGNARTAKAVFRISVPKKKHARKPGFVSPSTQSLAIAISGPTPVNATVGLTPTSPGCSLTFAGTTCTFNEQIAPGAYTASITSYDGPNGTGKVLSAAQGVPFTVQAAAANQVNLTLSGVPASLQILPATSFSSLNLQGVYDLYGTTAHRFYVEAYDGDGNAIVGPGSPSFTVAPVTGSLVVTVGAPTTAAPNAFTITPPAAYTTGTQKLSVTATYAPGLTNGCGEPGANCATTLTVDMQELVAAAGNGTMTIYPAGSTRALATVTYAINTQNGIAFDAAGDIFVANCLAGCNNGTSIDNVAVFTPPYTALPIIISNGVNTPQAVAVNASGDLFVANCLNCGPGGTDNVAEYTPPFTASSAPVATIGLSQGVAAPIALAFDSSANLFVANCPASCAQPFSGNDSVTKYAPPYTGAAAATIGVALLNNPNVLALDGSANLFVSDNNNNNVIEFLKSSAYSNLGSVAIANGVNGPQGLALDSSANLFVANGGANTVTEYAPGSYASAPSTTVSTNVNNPSQIAVDGAGNLYVTNFGSGRFSLYPTPYSGAGTRLNNSNEYYTAVLP